MENPHLCGLPHERGIEVADGFERFAGGGRGAVFEERAREGHTLRGDEMVRLLKRFVIGEPDEEVARRRASFQGGDAAQTRAEKVGAECEAGLGDLGSSFGFGGSRGHGFGRRVSGGRRPSAPPAN